MLPSDTVYLQVLIVLLCLTMAGWVVFLLRFAENRMPNGLRSPRYPLAMATVLFLWLGLTGFMAWLGVFARFDTVPPNFAFGPLGGMAVLLYVVFSRRFARRLDAIPPGWLVQAQAFRIGVELLFWGLFLAGAAPELMTFEGRNFDILVGLSAPVVGYFSFRGRIWKKGLVAVWNVAGILILAVTVAHGVLSAPTLFQQIETSPPNIFMGYFPFFWVPAFLAPLGFILHAASLRQVLRMRN